MATNPDRPAGRGMKEQPSPVKAAALGLGLDVLQPSRVRDPAFIEELRGLAPEVAVVVAYGKILPVHLLAVPRLGFVNVHFSLLPEYRGAAPVQRAVMQGRAETGVSIMVLTEGMDEGPVLATRRLAIGDEATAGDVGEELAHIGAGLLPEVLDLYSEGSLTPLQQDHALATYAPKITPGEARIDWSKEAPAVHDHVRGLNPAPGAWTMLREQRLKVWRTRVLLDRSLEPGQMRAGEGLVCGTGDGSVALEEVQPAGKKRMGGAELARGLRAVAGERLI